jgi:rhamnogalacturonyl hydrolase YesR
MARVLATVLHWDGAGGNRTVEKKQLVQYVGEIVDGAMQVGMDNSTGLLRNYLDDASWFGETSGTALFAATVYRMAVLVPERFATPKYLGWADDRRKAIAAHVDDDGILSPAVNPLNWGSRTPYTAGSPEGQSFGVLLYAAYRDCVCAGTCK